MAHTPGPWEVRGEFIGPRLSPDSDIQLKVARIAGPPSNPECEANAHLIAAAPELLSSLEAIVSAARHPHDDRMVRARAAITKANGGRMSVTSPTSDTRGHVMGPSRLNHGDAQCVNCHATDREIALALGPVCPCARAAPEPTPA